MASVLAILSQTNLIIEKFYFDNESDFKKQYRNLRKYVSNWLDERNSKHEDVDLVNNDNH